MAGVHGSKERSIQKRIIDYLRKREKSFTVKLAAGPYSMPGLPDVLHVEGGRAYFFEVKRPGEQPTKLQMAVMEKLIGAGAVVAVVTDVEQAKEVVA